MQQPPVLCLGLAKCDSACGRMGITYVFDRAIEQVCGVMEFLWFENSTVKCNNCTCNAQDDDYNKEDGRIDWMHQRMANIEV